jgi:hypothetical protein
MTAMAIASATYDDDIFLSREVHGMLAERLHRNHTPNDVVVACRIAVHFYRAI